jgi:hypothetical protein
MDGHGYAENGACLCFRTWVLVIHHDFKGVENFERLGNDADVHNLRRVFQEDRKCKFAEMKNWAKNDILSTLQSEKRIAKLFHHDDECELFQDFFLTYFTISDM